MRRRKFLVIGAVAPAAALAACSDGDEEPRPGRAEGSKVPGPDLDALEFAAGLEVVAETTYRKVSADMAGGRLGEVPAAASELVQSAATQHGQCLAEINDLLRKAGRTPTKDGNTEFETSVVTPTLTAAKAWPEVAGLARTIETALSATYLQSIHSTLQSPAALRLAGGIQATGQKRIAVLNFLLGEYPVPDTFQKTDAAVRA